MWVHGWSPVTVDPYLWNEPAIRFYRSHGAVPLDDWTRFRVTGAALRGG